jgi:hypothetical protein
MGDRLRLAIGIPDLDIEELAALEHDVWAGWLKWQFESLEKDLTADCCPLCRGEKEILSFQGCIGTRICPLCEGTGEQTKLSRMIFGVLIAQPCMQRWHRQMQTSYENLSEKEQESDRIEARKRLKITRPDYEG